MTRILAIESAGPICSVAMFENEELMGMKEHPEENSHAEHLATFCKNLIDQFGKPDAISLNIGPGSYTGLRIGTSLVKGLAFGLNVPVLGVSGLNTMADYYLHQYPQADFLIPCIDARRMEVYQTVIDKQGLEVEAIQPLVVDETAWSHIQGFKIVLGDGADKLKGILGNREDIMVEAGFRLSALYQHKEAFRKFRLGDYLDLAYFEPFYLKEFMITKKKN